VFDVRCLQDASLAAKASVDDALGLGQTHGTMAPNSLDRRDGICTLLPSQQLNFWNERRVRISTNTVRGHRFDRWTMLRKKKDLTISPGYKHWNVPGQGFGNIARFQEPGALVVEYPAFSEF
jgi:hypothetical protein